MKKHWLCPDCDRSYAKAGWCKACDTRLVHQWSRVPVLYHCRVCKTTSYKRGRCANEECEAEGVELVRRCSSSDVISHVL